MLIFIFFYYFNSWTNNNLFFSDDDIIKLKNHSLFQSLYYLYLNLSTRTSSGINNYGYEQSLGLPASRLIRNMVRYIIKVYRVLFQNPSRPVSTFRTLRTTRSSAKVYWFNSKTARRFGRTVRNRGTSRGR